MPLTQEEITAITRSVLRESNSSATLTGVSASDGGTNRVELIITLEGCHPEPCRILLNLDRVDRSRLENDLRAQLRNALEEHSSR
jgi:hypothetical protein